MLMCLWFPVHEKENSFSKNFAFFSFLLLIKNSKIFNFFREISASIKCRIFVKKEMQKYLQKTKKNCFGVQ